MDPREIDQHFFSLVSMFAAACWQHLGKMPDETSGEIQRDLESAQVTIDILLMIQDKTKGNLTNTEARLLSDTISALQANYAEEAAKDSVS